MQPKLELRNVSLAFGALKVTNDVSLSLAAGARTALIGPNGAGKTTLINLISGVLRPSSGSIRIDGRDVVRFNQDRRVKEGIGRTFQINRLFRDLSVEENLRIAVIQQQGRAHQLIGRRAVDDGIQEAVIRILAQLGIADRAGTRVRHLAYGEQRLLEIAMALALQPKVLLLDEPAAGVPKGESEIIIGTIERLPKDLAVLLIEHDMDLVFRFASDIHVLASGALIASGPASEIARNERVREVYFGRGKHGQ
ncbi:ABC transporter ATP-binding protein [Pararobbsia silviterrae]|uniref:ABC transporter ATP-binding protein n=1 Tax=Pararobbsia silviterrae TaxID=1792498 RepID=A0A494XM33_9BURK|nr:ABC transporter ATP-binding protein [Pararobbsia silviterrae]RKP51750.1 ABC transporter ATP-binding protein [Pararobbsia silviterrae]